MPQFWPRYQTDVMVLILLKHNGEVYCKACYGRRFGPKGVGIGGVGIHADGNAPGTAGSATVQAESVVNVGSFVNKVDVPAPGPSFCPNCGTGCKGARFCPSCGTKL